MTADPLPLHELCAALEAPIPSPAGGSAAAAAAALAASLVVMVGRGSPAWAEGTAAASEAVERRERLLALGGQDADAVAALLEAGRASGAGAAPRLHDARLRATRVPLEIAEEAAAVAVLARAAARHGKQAMRPDAAAAATLAEAAARVARSIVGVNLAAFPAAGAPEEVELLRAAARTVSGRLAGDGADA